MYKQAVILEAKCTNAENNRRLDFVIFLKVISKKKKKRRRKEMNGNGKI